MAARRVRSAPYLFIAPAVTAFTLLLAVPIGYALYLSLREMRITGLGLGPGARAERWAGLANYSAALRDHELLAGAGRVLVYGGLLVPVMLGLALVFGLLLDADRTRLRAFSRIAIFLPYAVPGVVATLLWGFLYLPTTSPGYYVLHQLGMSGPQLLQGNGMYVALANIAIWGGTGFNMIVIYTSLRSIPAELYEAARLDGASEFQIALRIKIPMVLPSLVLTFFFSLIATLQVFAEPMNLKPLTNGISSTWSPLMKVYRDAFTRGDIYSASATSVVIAFVTLAVSFGFLKLAGRRAYGEDNS
ncbi:sugar ABC transporter permease [Streptacidiphilus pinicola]|uniref:Sugar ABC transporter permease n=1 Tax=Streptacidiphilus pinicola TaxID=2219663 RepID=A0A2X0JAL7_9ACTN|nr:sugar ABC transporter permease [Streptacidiphilus pinicola]RAG87286.1 sugar ABC transporter permease [Streptacidiphilus pinicola]